jgi:lactoylglutathione lyase
MTSWLRQYCIYVTDLDRTVRFYETIGLKCTSRTVITEDIEEAILENPDKGGWVQLATNPKATGGRPVDMGTAMWKLYIYTDDCQGVYDAAMAAGYSSISAPASGAPRWPSTIAFVSDPDGYQVELVQKHEVQEGIGGSPRDQM